VPATDPGKPRSAKNGTKHRPCGGPSAQLLGKGWDEFAALQTAVTSD
jgi:hypothetical protein